MGFVVLMAMGVYLLISLGVVAWAVGHAKRSGKSVRKWVWGTALGDAITGYGGNDTDTLNHLSNVILFKNLSELIGVETVAVGNNERHRARGEVLCGRWTGGFNAANDNDNQPLLERIAA